MVVRDPSTKGLPLFLSVHWQKSTMDRHTLDGLSFTTIMTVRYPSPKGLHTFSKCLTTDIDDGPSLSRRSVLLFYHYCQRLSFWGSINKHYLCKTWQTPWRSIILSRSRHLVRRVSLLLQRCHYIFALMLILCRFCLSCLLLLVLLLILYSNYL